MGKLPTTCWPTNEDRYQETMIVNCERPRTRRRILRKKGRRRSSLMKATTPLSAIVFLSTRASICSSRRNNDAFRIGINIQKRYNLSNTDEILKLKTIRRGVIPDIGVDCFGLHRKKNDGLFSLVNGDSLLVSAIRGGDNDGEDAGGNVDTVKKEAKDKEEIDDDETLENRELDKYIEQLIASVDEEDVGALDADETAPNDESDDESITTGEPPRESNNMIQTSDEDSSNDSDEEKQAKRKEELQQDDTTPKNEQEEEDVKDNGDTVAMNVDVAAEKDKDVTSKKIEGNEEEGETKASTEVDPAVPTKKKRRKKKKKAQSKQKLDLVDSSTLKDEPDTSAPIPNQAEKVLRKRYSRPNALYRFLLGSGRIGHFVLMACIIIVEFVQLYVPILAYIIKWIMVKLFGTSSSTDEDQYYYSDDRNRLRENDGLSSSRVNVQYTGFVSTTGTAVRGSTGGSRRAKKQMKAEKKKVDQVALDKLRDIGNTREAKYKYLSINFMKRYKIGPFGDVHDDEEYGEEGEKSKEEMRSSQKGKQVRRNDSEDKHVDDEDDDIDWVVEAFKEDTAEKEELSSTSKEEVKSFQEEESEVSALKPSISISSGSDRGTSVSVGLDLKLGGRNGNDMLKATRKKKRKASKSKSIILDAIQISSSQATNSKKALKRPKRSDKDGGGGVLGRIRAAGVANNLMSRSLMGAYPGDAVPTNLAGSSHGVIDLARKYGYGEWNNEDDDEEYSYYDGDGDDGGGIIRGDYDDESYPRKNVNKSSSSSTTLRKKKKRIRKKKKRSSTSKAS